MNDTQKQLLLTIGIIFVLWYMAKRFYTNNQIYNPPSTAISSVQPKPPYHH